jgi:multiple sugar transport system substrate-binding protein
MCLLWQNGGQELDMTRRVATWNSPAGVEALQFWVDLVHRHNIVPLQQPANTFQTGRAGFWHLPVGSVSSVQRAVQEQFQWTTAPLQAGKQRASNVGGHTLAVMKTNKHHEPAWRFVHWFTSPQNVVEFNVPSVTLPPWQSAQQQPTWQRFTRDQPWVKPFVDMLAYGHPPVKLTTGNDVLKTLGEGIESAMTQKQPPKQALDEAARVAEPFIKEG